VEGGGGNWALGDAASTADYLTPNGEDEKEGLRKTAEIFSQ